MRETIGRRVTGRRLLTILLALVGSASTLGAQNIVSVPFTNGFIGTRSSSAGTANNVLTFATLGIARTFFIQNSSTNAFELQGNDIPGTLRIVRANGTTLDIPASANWRNSGGSTYLIGILPRPASPITFSYSGGSIQITDGSTSGGSSIGGYVAAYLGSTLADGGSTNGNAAQSQVLSGMNAYLATVVASRPAGPVTVTTLTTSNTTPTITGTATLAAGENLSVTISGVQYTTSSSPAIVRNSNNWSLALTTQLAVGTYEVTAVITNTDGFTLTDATSNELVITSAGGTVTLSGSFSANDKVYDGTVGATGTTGSVTLLGVNGADQVTVASVTLGFQTAAVGNSKTVVITTVTLGGTNGAQYTVSLTGAPTSTANVTAKPLTITGVTAVNKTYDAATAAALAGTASYVGLAAGETFTVGGTPTANFVSATVGNAKSVLVSGYTAPSANYTLTQPTGLTANITTKLLTIGGSFTAANKLFDGTTAASITTNSLTLVGVEVGDVVSLTGATATFGDAAVGNAKTVTLTAASLAGASSSNYALSLAGAPTTTANITPLGGTVTITGTFTANDKTYDGTTAATGTTNGLTLAGVNCLDQVTIVSVTLAFQTATVGTGKTVVITNVTLGGANGAGYAVNLAGAPTATAGITAKALSIGGSFTAANKVFDGTNTATIASNSLTLVGVENGDAVALTGEAATFASASIGTGKLVTLTAANLTGGAAGNYTLSLAGAPTTTANITSPGGTVTVGGTFTANDKTYDGTVAATGTTSGLTLVGVNGSDQVTIASVTLAFQAAAVGNTKTVVITNVTLGGTDAGIYNVNLAGAPTASANIATKSLTVTGINAASKTYDALTTAALTGVATYAGLASGENFAVSGTPTANFSTAVVGNSKTVTVTGYTAPTTNYTVTQPSGLIANITAKTVTIGGSFTAANKVFDGTTTATIATNSLAIVGVEMGDAVSLTNVVAGFTSASVGTAKTVSLTTASLGGAAAANYALSLTGAPTTTANITSAGGTVTISGSFTAIDKVYDGTVAATGNTSGLTLAGVNGSDQVTIASVTIGFQTASVGSGKTVVITAVTLGGANGALYGVNLSGAPTTTARITPKALTVAGTFAAANRMYDGTTSATVTSYNLTLVGVINATDVTIANPTAAFPNPFAGTLKPVALIGASLTGVAASNYTLSFTGAPATNANITPRPLTIGGSFNAADKIFDGATAATITANNLTLVGVLNGDAVALAGVTAGFADATVGNGKPVGLTAANLTGSLATNYSVNLAGAPVAAASITAASPPSPPLNVVSTAGDGTITVAWALPQFEGCRAVTGYVVEYSTDDGHNWTRVLLTSRSPTTTTLQALTNNVVHRVRVAAVNSCGTSDFAAAANVVPLGPTRNESGRPPTPRPGTVSLTTNGVTELVTLEVVRDTTLRLASGNFSLTLHSNDDAGVGIPIDSTRTLELDRGGKITTEGKSFAPGTIVTVYIYTATGQPLLLGQATVNADGTFAATLPVPNSLTPGEYTLQVNGVDRTLTPRSLALDVSVAEPPAELELTSEPNQRSPAVGDTLVITITVANKGTGPAVNVIVPRAFKEAGFGVLKTTPLEGTYNPVTQEWTINRIEPGARARMLLTVVVLPPPASPESNP